MARFRVLVGKHHEGGRTYVRGEIVDSATDLSKMNAPGVAPKFERVDDDASRRDFAARQQEIQRLQEDLDRDRAESAAQSAPAVPAQPSAAPGGQVSTGFQQTAPAPDGTPVSGPVPVEELTEAEARDRAMGTRRPLEVRKPATPVAVAGKPTGINETPQAKGK